MLSFWINFTPSLLLPVGHRIVLVSLLERRVGKRPLSPMTELARERPALLVVLELWMII